MDNDMIMIDTLVAGFWRVKDGTERPVVEAIHAGGLTAISITHAPNYCRVVEALRHLSVCKKWLREHSDILTQVYTVEDIRRAHQEKKLGIILNWQDSTGFDDFLPHVATFKELGLGIVQLTYNTANAVGSGCFEGHDGGLTDFGRELVSEMNRVGMAIDLSHCGRETSRQTILASQRPVMYSHVAPNAFKTFERNKTDEELRFIADNGGYIGVSLHPPFLRHGNDSTIADYVEVIEYTINVAGEDHVGLGTDYICGPPVDAAAWEMLIRDKYHARKLTDVVMPEIRYPSEFDQMRGFRSIPEAMAQRGWTEERIRKVVGGNCLRFLEQAWSHQ